MILLNCSNLHNGGGVQVATSIISEILSFSDISSNLTIWASSEINNNLNKMGLDLKSLPNYEVVDSYGLQLIISSLRFRISNFSSVATVFGPLYIFRRPNFNITGFAQPWIIYPNNECYSKLSYLKGIKARLKYWVQGFFFKRADVIVVELEHVKQRLISELCIPSENIHVVHNCISSIYLNESFWQSLDMPNSEGRLSLGYLGRNYIHKNTIIFPSVVKELELSYGIKAVFYVTFTDQEWEACTPDFRAVCINVGPLSVAQCPRFYQNLDAVVFPSLLECFSATPLESMAMEKPLFASDRPFNRDVCASHAHYFDPLNGASAAQAIARVFRGTGTNITALAAARQHAINFSNPKERAEKYLALLKGNL